MPFEFRPESHGRVDGATHGIGTGGGGEGERERASGLTSLFVSPRLPEAFVPLAPRGDGRGDGVLGLGDQLDSLVDGGDGVEGGVIGRPKEDEGVGGVLLAQRPGLVVGRVADEAGGRGGLQAEGGGRVGLEEGEELRGQLEELVAA